MSSISELQKPMDISSDKNNREIKLNINCSEFSGDKKIFDISYSTYISIPEFKSEDIQVEGSSRFSGNMKEFINTIETFGEFIVKNISKEYEIKKKVL
jgi:hypothetical protein